MRNRRTADRDSTSQVRIYIADLSAYNAGKLIGEWVDLPADEGELNAVISKMSHGGKYDWAIHDYEAPFRIEEYEDITALNEMMWKVEDSHLDIEILACIKDYGYDNWDDVLEAAEDAFVEEAKDDTDLAYVYVESMGGAEQMGAETLNMYFDYEQYGRDASMELYDDEAREHYDQFHSDREYGEALITDQVGLSGNVTEVFGEDGAARYFDYESFGRDLATDYFQCGNYYIRLG